MLVVMDVSQPILRGTTVKVNGEMKILNVKYDRCPDFCYKCGILGHGEKIPLGNNPGKKGKAGESV